MKELIVKDVMKNLTKGKDQYNDDTISYLTDKINAILDIPFINEEVERIIIEAILQIIYSIIFARKNT